MSHLIASLTLLITCNFNAAFQDPTSQVDDQVVVTTHDGCQFSGRVDARTNDDFVVLCIEGGSSKIRYSIRRNDIGNVSTAASNSGSFVSRGRSMAQQAHWALFGR